MTAPLYVSYGGERIEYTVRPDSERSAKVAIHIEHDGRVIVDVPDGAEEGDIQRAVHKRARWIFTQVGTARDRFRHVRKKDYVSGEEILYLGRRYVLKVIKDAEARRPVKLRGNRLEVICPTGNPDIVRAHVWAWYRVKARDYFDRRLCSWQMKLSWLTSRPSFRIQEMEKRWGSCTPHGEIILNPHLIKAPRECIDYVILHELAHLRHHNHGPEFWQTVLDADPDWSRKKKRLDSQAEVLMVR